jgi:heptosyltransferase-2
MRNGYLVRAHKAVAFLLMVDGLLRLLLPGRENTQPPAQPRRILVANWAHLGDVITSLPTLRVLREIFPRARIDLVVGRGSRVVVEGSGLYDRLYCVDHFVLSRTKRSLPDRIRTYRADRMQFIAAARLEQYDVAIDLYPHFPPAFPLFRQADIPVRCGFTSGGFGPLLTHPVKWVYQDKSISQYGRDLIAALWPDIAQSIGRLPPYYPHGLTPAVPARLAPPDPRYVVVHMGAGANWKEWPEANWCRLIEMWGRDAPLLVFCGVGTPENERARRVAASSPTGRTMLFIDRSWPEFTALVAGAAGLICLESSASHVAAALSIPTVAIYSGTNEHRLWGPDNPNARILSAPTACAPCHRSGCETMACVREVTPETVLAALHAVMHKVST